MDLVGTLQRARLAWAGAANAGAARHPAADAIWDRLAWFALIVAAILVLFTFTDYGVTWDEDAHNWYGVLPTLPRRQLLLVVKLGLAIGLALGVRIGGLLFLCYLGLLLALAAGWQAAAARRLSVLVAAGWTSLWRVLLPVAAIGFAMMLLSWPWGQQSPIGNPLHALAFFSHQQFPYSTLFDGRFVPAADLPWDYLPTHIVLALPELVLALLIAATALAAIELARGLAQPHPLLPRPAVLALLRLGVSIVFPVAC